MFTTSMTAALVAGLLASGSLGLPEWTDSYGKAMAQAGEKHKPMAVFLTTGDLNGVTNGKGLGADVLKSLKADYIAVKIDTTTEDGKTVAAAFGISQGVVLSDRTGKTMALKHEGPVTGEQLAVYLTKYAATETIHTTEYQSSLVVPPVQYQQQYQPQYQQPRPVMNAIQTVGGTIQNVGGVVFSPFVGGS